MMAILLHNPTIDVSGIIPSFTVKDETPDWKVQTKMNGT